MTDAAIGRNAIEDAQAGWFAVIIVGGTAGWLARQFMQNENGLLVSIIFGISGAVAARALLGPLGDSLTGTLGYLFAGFSSACILIAAGRAVGR